MPFVKKVFGDNIKIVPIMVGTLDAKMAEEYGKLMVKYYEDPNTIFIVSTDFCHWGINYDYQPYDKQSGLKIWEYIKRMDEEGMKLIEKNDINGFWKYIRETQNSVCGEMGIKIFMNALQNSKQKYVTKFVQYDQSNNVENWDDFSVSYATSITYRV